MSLFITILVIIICILLVLVILVQNPKGGLDSAFSTNNQLGGVRQTTDFLEKSTWTLGIAIVCLSILSAFVNNSFKGEAEEAKSKVQEKALETTFENPNKIPTKVLEQNSNLVKSASPSTSTTEKKKEKKKASK